MKKVKEYYICDRCKKEFDKNKLYVCNYNMWSYDLCEYCKKDLETLELAVNNYLDLIRDEEERYQFGRYLPKDKEK